MHTVRTHISRRPSRTISGPRYRLAAALVALATIPSGVGCSRRTPAPESLATGGVSIALKLSDTSEIIEVSYTVSGNGITPIMGKINAISSAPELLVTGVPVGNGLLVELTAVSTDMTRHCAGSVMVNVAAGVVTPATVLLQCQGPGSFSTGGVMVGGRFDNCPYFRSYSVAPLKALVPPSPSSTDGAGGGGGGAGGSAGAVVKFNVAGGDDDGDTLKITVTSSAAIGTLDVMKGSLPSTIMGTFICTSVGMTNLIFEITDGDCAAKPQTIPVSCVEPSVPTGAAGSGGGEGTGGVAGGAAGAGGNGGNAGSAGSSIAGAAGGQAGAAGQAGRAGAAGQAGTAGAAGQAGGASGSAGGQGGAAGGGAAGAGGGTASTCDGKAPTECVSAACARCTAENCSDTHATAGCQQQADPGDRALCESAYACFVDSASGSACALDTKTCWCGTNWDTCFGANAPPTQANGPCLQQVFAAAKSTDAPTIRARFSDESFPVGLAVGLVGCRGGFCAAECGLHSTN